MDRAPSLETDRAHKLVKGLAPYTLCLLETVDHLEELEAVEISIHLDAFRNDTEHLLLPHSIQVRSHHIKLVEGPSRLLGNGDHYSQRHILDHGRKRLRVVDAILWRKPFTTSRALYFSIDPSALRLILKTHLVPMALCLLGNLAARNTPRSFIEMSSAPIALRRCAWSGPLTASSNVDGSEISAVASTAFALACQIADKVGVSC